MQDGSFTCTLFAPAAFYAHLESDSSGSLIPPFFDKYFPGVTDLISPDDLISSFHKNPHLPLINIKCKPYHFSSSVVIVGDAAHAMVPFYGQGMNAGLEDVRILFNILDKHGRMDELNTTTDPASTRERALEEYSAVRVQDAHAINDLALQNYVEMRSSVLSPAYRFRKWLEEGLSKYFPGLGWQTKYSRVSFGNERYSEVVAKSEHQGQVLTRVLTGVIGAPVLVGVVAAMAAFYFRNKKAVDVGLKAAMGSVDSLVELMAMKA